MLDKKTKQKIINKFKIHPNDTGSPEVQIAILSKEIEILSSHLKKHRKDFSSRRGLIKKVHQRRRLLQYLFKEDEERYKKIVKKLKLKSKLPVSKVEEDIKKEEEEERKTMKE